MRGLVIALLALAACRPPGYGKGGDDDGRPDAATALDASTVDAPPDAVALCDRAFRLEGHESAGSVWLTGDFVSWGGNPAAGALELVRGGDGAWIGARTFAAGTYLYKFVVDTSAWIADPSNPDMVDDGFGGKNSRYICAP